MNVVLAYTSQQVFKVVFSGNRLKHDVAIDYPDINDRSFGDTGFISISFENDAIVGRAKNTAIAGNIFTAFKDQLAAIGNEAEWVGGRAQLPHVLLDGLSVAAKE